MVTVDRLLLVYFLCVLRLKVSEFGFIHRFLPEFF